MYAKANYLVAYLDATWISLSCRSSVKYGMLGTAFNNTPPPSTPPSRPNVVPLITIVTASATTNIATNITTNITHFGPTPDARGQGVFFMH